MEREKESRCGNFCGGSCSSTAHRLRRHALQAHSRMLRISLTLQNSRSREAKRLPIREFFGADVEGIEGVGAVGAVFEQGFFGLCEFFAGLVFAEAVASSADSG